VELPVWPLITFSNDWCERRPGSLGDCDPTAEELAFHAGAFQLMPDGVAAIVIARELCHALFVVEERDFSCAEEEEKEVDHTLVTWGLKTEVLREWVRTTRVTLRAAGVYRCGWCGERDIPEGQAPLLQGPFGWEPICRDCFATAGGPLSSEPAQGTKKDLAG
jgi:hypothetical protein